MSLGSPFVPDFVYSPYSETPIAVTLTEDIYWAAQPTAVQALRNMPEDQRFDTAVALAKAGYTIDFPIMVWGWSAVVTMFLRIQDGYTWTPRADGNPITLAPGLTFPGKDSYDPSHPPAGSIKSSVTAADYKPFAPVVVVPPQTAKLFGGPVGDGSGRLYGGPAAMVNSFTPAVQDGKEYTEDGVTAIAHVTRGLMGYSVQFSPVV